MRQSLDSVFRQTLPPDQVVMVIDGPVGEELEAVIADYPRLDLARLPENRGLGRALNEGLKRCRYDLVARMDTDDVCKPARFERQVGFMAAHPELAASGTWIDEFVGSTDNVVSRRATVETPEEVARFARSRNPLNHPSVIFRKEAVEAVGSYRHFPLFEDWYLWARLIAAGRELANIPEALLWFRTSPDTFKRRGGWRYARDSARFQFALRRLGLVSTASALKNSILRGGVYLMPNALRGAIYKKFLRK